MTTTRHVVLVTYGEPPTSAFIDQLVYSWRILVGLTRTVAPIPRPLLPLIAVARASGRQRLWDAHQYGSPLEPITERQARRLEATLASAETSAPEPWRVHVGYEFRRPLLTEVLQSIPAGEPVWVAPMYATDSAFTHALSRGTSAAHHAGSPGRQPIRVLDALPTEILAELSAAHVLRETAGEDSWRGQGVALVLAAHGTVLEPVRPIDTGLVATEALCQAISRRLSDHFGMVVNGWLNHTRGGPWTDPPVDRALARIVEAGYQRVVYFPYGFLADNAESELEGRVALRQISVESRHLGCLNESPELIAALALQVRRKADLSRCGG